MLFVQGTRDKLAETILVARVTTGLGQISVHMVDQADHAFHVPARSGRTDSDIVTEIADAFAAWIARISA